MAHILVVEDSPDGMKLFSAVLTLSGHRVTGLADGEHLLEILASDPPDLVLMDIQLPVKDGFTLLREIRTAGFRVTVLALTAHAMSGDMERALAAGFDGYVTKPIDVLAFPGQIQRALRSGGGTDLAS